ncbi:DUF4157 domain-containing protein [Leptolyngbya sp. DQ-M1]|uniref:eCIS core domain-containing protein n=1 Tax=Leptolyngbya sp. DQ-M1 TaxID=2933920 RepID=UPI00329849CE
MAIGSMSSPALQRAAIANNMVQRQDNTEEEEKQEEEPIQAKAIAPLSATFLQQQEVTEEQEKDETESIQAKVFPGQGLTHFSQSYGQRVTEMGVQNASRVPMLQRKLTIGQPNDLYEQEADRMADQVMRMPERSLEDETEVVQTQPLANSITPLVQQEREDKPAEGEIQAKEGTVPTVTLSLEAQLQEQQGKGQPLSEKIRTFMESRFRQDFSGVRVHTDSNAKQMNRELNAHAFTHQRDVFFGAGKYTPESIEGKRLLAHELTHVVQQTGKVQANLPLSSHNRNNPVTGIVHTVDSYAAIQRQDTTTPVTAAQLIDQHTSWGNLDEEGLGKDLASRLPSESLLASDVLSKLSSSDRDDVAYEITAASSGKLAAIPDWLRIRFVEEMVSGVVTDEEEGAISIIWISFEPNLATIAEKNRSLWKKSLWESDQLVEHVQPIREQFQEDVIGLARAYLSENKQALVTEAGRYGVDLDGKQSIIPTLPGYQGSVQSIIPGVLKLKNYLDELKQIRVGYVTIIHPGSGREFKSPVTFDPERKPESPPKKTESPPWPTWEQVKTQYDRTSAVISAFANIYPSIYILIQRDKLETVAESTDAAKAQQVITEAMQKTNEKIKEATEKLGKDITHYDLKLIQAQLFSGSAQVPYEPKYHWEQPFYQDIANDDIKGHEARQFWIDLGLSLAATAALIAAPFTGGATAAFLVGFGLGIETAQAGMSWDKYLDMATMGDATVKEELTLISTGEINAQLVDAIIQTVAVFLDVYGARAATTGAKASREALEAAEKGVKEQLAEEIRKKALREAGKEAGMTAAGAGVAIGMHEFADDEPDYQIGGTATRHQIDLGQETPESTQTTVSPMLIQRANGGGSPGAVATPPKQPIILTGGEFEVYVEKALLKGTDGLPKMDFVIPGQYRGGSGWGIDRIGIVYDDITGKINVYHFEMKFVSKESDFVPGLKGSGAGAQTGAGWTDNAIDGFLNSQHRNARAGKERLRRAMKKMNLDSDIASMRKFLKNELVNAPVIIVTPNWAKLSKLYKQVAAFIRHGRDIKILTVFKK